MALLASIETDSGAVSEYQRITHIEYSAGDTNWYLTVEYYVSAAAREAGKQPLRVKRVALPDYRLSPSPVAEFYAALAQFEHTELSQAGGDEQHESRLFVLNDLDPARFTVESSDDQSLPPAVDLIESVQLQSGIHPYPAGSDLGDPAAGAAG